MILFSIFLDGTGTIEHQIMSKYFIHPLQLIGYEGLFGILIYIFLLVGLTYIPCPFGRNACVFTPEGYPFFASPKAYFDEVSSSHFLLLITLGSFLASIFLNIAGVSIMKNVDGLARLLVNQIVAVVTWMGSIGVTLSLGEIYPNLRW